MTADINGGRDRGSGPQSLEQLVMASGGVKELAVQIEAAFPQETRLGTVSLGKTGISRGDTSGELATKLRDYASRPLGRGGKERALDPQTELGVWQALFVLAGEAGSEALQDQNLKNHLFNLETRVASRALNVNLPLKPVPQVVAPGSSVRPSYTPRFPIESSVLVKKIIGWQVERFMKDVLGTLRSVIKHPERPLAIATVMWAAACAKKNLDVGSPTVEKTPITQVVNTPVPSVTPTPEGTPAIIVTETKTPFPEVPYPTSTEGFAFGLGGNSQELRDGIVRITTNENGVSEALGKENLVKWQVWQEDHNGSLDTTQKKVDDYYAQKYGTMFSVVPGKSWTLAAQNKETKEFYVAVNLDGVAYLSLMPERDENGDGIITIDDFDLLRMEMPEWADGQALVPVLSGNSRGHHVLVFTKNGEMVGWYDAANARSVEIAPANPLDVSTFPEKYQKIANDPMSASPEAQVEFQEFMEGIAPSFLEREAVKNGKEANYYTVAAERMVEKGIDKRLLRLSSLIVWQNENNKEAMENDWGIIITPIDAQIIKETQEGFSVWDEQKYLDGNLRITSFGLNTSLEDPTLYLKYYPFNPIIEVYGKPVVSKLSPDSLSGITLGWGTGNKVIIGYQSPEGKWSYDLRIASEDPNLRIPQGSICTDNNGRLENIQETEGAPFGATSDSFDNIKASVGRRVTFGTYTRALFDWIHSGDRNRLLMTCFSPEGLYYIGTTYLPPSTYPFIPWSTVEGGQ